MKGNITESLQFAKNVAQLCIFFIEKEDSHKKHALKVVMFVYSAINEIITPEQRLTAGEIMQDIVTYNANTKYVPAKEPIEVSTYFLTIS